MTKAAGHSDRDFSLWKLAPSVFVPALLFEIGIGAILPVIAAATTRLGGSLGLAGLMTALLAIGQILGDLPAGALAARIGDRRAMALAACAGVVAVIAAALAPNLVAFAVAIGFLGAINAVFLLARQSYLTEVTPVQRRARALSTLAGLQRIGYFIGPFVGAAVILAWGMQAAFWLAVTTSAATAIVVLVTPEPAGVPPAHEPEPHQVSMWQVLRDHRAIFATLGIAIFAVGATRGARQTVIPLWAEHLGIEPATTSLLFAVSGAADMLLFYPSGKIMDRFGRLWVGVPSMLLLGTAMICLPFAATPIAVGVAAIFIGLGNGIGSGVLMTLGADTAPTEIRAQFLAVWRLIQDSGNATGPLVVSAGAALGSLAGGIIAMGAVGIGAAGALLRWTPRWSVHACRRTREAAGIVSSGPLSGAPEPIAGPPHPNRPQPGKSTDLTQAQR